MDSGWSSMAFRASSDASLGAGEAGRVRKVHVVEGVRVRTELIPELGELLTMK